MTESQGSDQVKDFDTQYSELLTGLKTAADKLLDDKKLMINFDIAVKPGKDNTLDTLTISGKVEDTLNNTNPESISFKLETKAEKFVPISDFPTKEQILSKEELTLIISDFARQMYINSGVY
ncbi:hypothetical protein IA817_15470 [Listeria seeligeri]|nr:hypothetical protein [Listeria seeligeri]